MTAWAYTVAYNEARLLPYWIRHYKTFCEQLIVFVEHDTLDLTREIARAMGAQVRSYRGTNQLDDLALIAFAEEQYREARNKTDWVVWTDVDEIVYHPRLVERLAEYVVADVGVPLTTGYAMIGDDPPLGSGQIYNDIKCGVPSVEYAKLAVFDPRLDVHWTAGKHSGSIGGSYQIDDGHDPLKLLHYRWLGEQWFIERNKRNFSRVDGYNRLRQHGKETYPEYSGKFSVQWYKEQIHLSKEVV